jgi:DNA-binding PadR family transcriptional regulator
MIDLDLLILGVLTGKPSHGYLIKRHIESIFGKGYFSLSNSHLYPRLARLEMEGCIKGYKESLKGRPDRKVYELMPTGMQRFKELLASPIDTSDSEMDVLSRAFLFEFITLEERRRVIEPLYEHKLIELEKGKAKMQELEPYLNRCSRAATAFAIDHLERTIALYRTLMTE